MTEKEKEKNWIPAFAGMTRGAYRGWMGIEYWVIPWVLGVDHSLGIGYWSFNGHWVFGHWVFFPHSDFEIRHLLFSPIAYSPIAYSLFAYSLFAYSLFYKTLIAVRVRSSSLPRRPAKRRRSHRQCLMILSAG